MISRDGRNYKVPAGEKVVIKSGESLTLYPYYYHEFYVEKGQGYALLSEVSMCNDDNLDNRFEQKLGRFPTIIEDEPAYRLLCNEYPVAAK
jgi:D-lyxose ketol-isomerase